MLRRLVPNSVRRSIGRSVARGPPPLPIGLWGRSVELSPTSVVRSSLFLGTRGCGKPPSCRVGHPPSAPSCLSDGGFPASVRCCRVGPSPRVTAASSADPFPTGNSRRLREPYRSSDRRRGAVTTRRFRAFRVTAPRSPQRCAVAGWARHPEFRSFQRGLDPQGNRSFQRGPCVASDRRRGAVQTGASAPFPATASLPSVLWPGGASPRVTAFPARIRRSRVIGPCRFV